jgi:hypothetical protein
VILCGDHGNRSISYAGDLSDANFIRLRQIAGAALQTWDRLRCLGTRPHATPLLAAAPPSSVAPGRPKSAADILLEHFRRENSAALQENSLSGRDLFIHAMTAPSNPARADFMAQFGVEWLDPTGDRKLLERLLTFPLHVFRVGNRPRGLARELARGLVPDSVRLRRTRRMLFPDQTAWFALRVDDYRRILQSVTTSNACAFFLDIPALQSMVETLCSGAGSATEAMIAHRALDAGLFAVEFEATHGLDSSRDLETSQDVPTLNGLANPVESVTRAHA